MSPREDLLISIAGSSSSSSILSGVGTVLSTMLTGKPFRCRKSRERLTGWSALLNVVLNLALIPGFGILGAATATVVAETLRMVLACWLAAQRGLAPPGPRAVLPPILAGALMAALLTWIELPLFAAIAVGALAFALCLLATGGHRPLLAGRQA